jgi:hypothetical protein
MPNEKKKELLMEGLDTKLWARLALNTRGSFNELISAAMTWEEVHCSRTVKWSTSKVPRMI